LADTIAVKNTTAGELLGRHKGLLVAVLIVALPAAIIAQLPTQLVDILLTVNITVSMIILLTTIYVAKPLDFSVFPSLLLVTTLYRLVLNVAATRLILTNAGTHGEYAAGSVIRAFGKFVAGDNVLVGFIIFLIVVIVQFVVITKGATRISEVAARFTLDGMPGKQMAVDGDLNAGLITETEARTRRAEITREADFYGAMDGASKYVRGDAIAGILIIVINIIGGLLIGILQYGFPIDKALRTYTLLTVGDGLVTQIPAFVISVGAGLIVTRSSTQKHLGDEIAVQLTSHPKALWIAAVFVGLLAFTGLPWVWMLSLSGLCAAAAAASSRAQAARAKATAEDEARKKAEAEAPTAEKVDLHVEALELAVGYGLIGLVGGKEGDGGFLRRIMRIRQEMGAEFGFVVPPIRVHDNMELDSTAYEVKIRGSRVGAGAVLPGRYLAVDHGMTKGLLEGARATEPVSGRPACWIAPTETGKAEMLGYSVVDGASVIASHLREVIRRHADEILSREDTQKLIRQLREAAPTVVDELIPNKLSVGEVQRVLQNLLREGVSIRNLDVIFETLSDCAGQTKDPEILTEQARSGLSRVICAKLTDAENRIQVVTLDPDLEDEIGGAVVHGERGSRLTLSAERVREINAAIARECEKLSASGRPRVVLGAPEIRLEVKRMTATDIPDLVVLSYGEAVEDVKVESVGMVEAS
jgi:flagellar biosynthesis protein FlhA